jgi:hypothetical protein
MNRGQQFDDFGDFDEYGEFDDTFEDLEIPSDDELDSLEQELLQTGALKKDDVAKVYPPLNPESFDLKKHVSKLPQPRSAEYSLEGWITGDPMIEDGDDETKYPNNEQYQWPSEYISQVMPRDSGAQARLELHKHLDKHGLVDRTNPDMPTVRLRRIGKPRVGVTNASYIPNWGTRSSADTAELEQSGYGKGKRSREESGDIGLYEWDAPLEHVLGSGMTAEGEVFAVHHPSTTINRVI